jgi:hypothetical protein
MNQNNKTHTNSIKSIISNYLKPFFAPAQLMSIHKCILWKTKKHSKHGPNRTESEAVSGHKKTPMQ